MKKITILVANRYIDSALCELRKVGVLHIKDAYKSQSEEVSLLEEELGSLNHILMDIKDVESGKEKDCGSGDISGLIKEMHSLSKQKRVFSDILKNSTKMLDWYRAWGKVSLESVALLKESGFYLRLYVVNKKNWKEISKDRHAYVVDKKKDYFYIVVIFKDTEEKIAFAEHVDFPEKEYSQLEAEYKDASKRIEEIDERIKGLACYRKQYQNYRVKLEKEIEFSKVKSNMSSEDEFRYLEGFSPCDAVSGILKLAESEHWGVLVQEPDNPDEVPTLLRNSPFIRIIQPIFKFMDVIPGYNEYDVSFWFLLFFSLFFAMIIGDAGYGILFLLSTFMVQRKKPEIPKEVFSLFYTLSFTTVIWGALTGTWFGLEQAANVPFLKTIAIESINSFLDTNQAFIMHLCFLIGVIHLTIAHVVGLLRFKSSLKALSHLGWIFIGWAMFSVVENVVLNKPLMSFSSLLLVFGVLLIVFFSESQRGFFKNIGIALFNLPLKIIGYFADILSYLRLFAVGYATVMVAVSFNSMAQDVGFNSVLTGLISVGVLLFGHVLNIMLGLMSVLVHGVRLNMLEFSSHLNIEWKGKRYNPFRE
ncbi:MAG: hypothetical protein P9M06_03200 [Candidatus Saelkia tenebricola]|nr:hypothetical protein [Candidatus Saelkia tenebricola]